MLVTYEIMSWFKHQQQQGLINSTVEWPEDSAVAANMLKYKKRGHAQVDPIATKAPRDIGTTRRQARPLHAQPPRRLNRDRICRGPLAVALTPVHRRT